MSEAFRENQIKFLQDQHAQALSALGEIEKRRDVSLKEVERIKQQYMQVRPKTSIFGGCSSH